MRHYLVAGATGRVGSVAAKALLEGGETVTVVVRDEKRRAEWAQRGATVAVGSLDDAEFLTNQCRQASSVFVLLPENVAPHEFHAARRRMADAITRAVIDSGVPHVVMLSAIAAVLPDGNGPAKDLHYLEQRLKSSGATVTVLRPSYYQDNIASVIPPARQAGIYPNFFPSADAAFPMIATRDVGRAVARALAATPPEPGVVDLLGPAYSVRQLAEKLGTAIGKPLHVVDIPPSRHVATLMEAGLPQQLAEAVAEMLATFAAGKMVPVGNRQEIGQTTIDDVLASLVGVVA